MNCESVVGALSAICAECKVRKALELFSEPALPNNPEPTQANRNKSEKAVTIRPLSKHGTSKSERSADGLSKVCHGCGKMLRIEEYSRSKLCSDGHMGTCKECFKKRRNNRYEAAKERENKLSAPVDAMPPPKPHECTVCHARFRAINTLAEHMNFMHGAQ